MPRPAGRVLALLELLQSGGTRTTSELAERLGVEERTVRRYVGQLLDLDVPVESVRGRYGGYRLSPGYRLPPLMFTDDEALNVLLGLLVSRRSGLLPAADTADATAAAKIRRVLPRRLAARLDAVLESLAFTTPHGQAAETGGTDVPASTVLLTVADAVRRRRPLRITYTDRTGRRGERTLHPYGIVHHAGRWYLTGADIGIDADRVFRLDRVGDARPLPGSFEPPADLDPARHVLSALADAPYRHEVVLRIHGTVRRIRTRLPESVARLDEADGDPDAEKWREVRLRAERLDWLPAVLAALDRPFVIERPGELRDLVADFAERLMASARRTR